MSQTTMDALVALCRDDENAKSGFKVLQTVVSEISVKESAFAAGLGGEGPFLQFAASPRGSSPELINRVAEGSASPEEVSEALLGKVGVLLSSMLSPKLQEGDFPYYSLLDGNLTLSAKDGLILIALSQKDLSDSITALGSEASRLAPSRRFESGDYIFAHLDMPFAAALAANVAKEGADPEAVSAEFKAPLEFEIAFDAKPELFRVSMGANVTEAIPSLKVFDDLKPAEGGNIFLAGGGSLFLAMSAPVSFDASRLAVSPAAAAAWKQLVAMLAPAGITEEDLQNLFSGVITIAAGNEASIFERKVPGVYVAIQGKDGAASAVLDKVFKNEEFSLPLPFASFESEGWSGLYALDPSAVPASVAAGVKGETLFIGLAEPGRLNDRPVISDMGETALKEKYMAGGFLDTDLLWKRLRTDSSDEGSALGYALANNQPSVAGFADEILGADLAVNFAKLWAPDFGTSFMEFSLTDVPEEKALMPRIANMLSKISAASGAKTVTTETSETKSEESTAVTSGDETTEHTIVTIETATKTTAAKTEIAPSDMAKAAEYALDGESLPGVYGVLGEREVIDARSGVENGAPYFAVMYKTDKIVPDLDAYLEKLVNGNNWAITKNELKTDYPEGSFITIMNESKDEGKLLVMTIECNDGAFTLNIAKAEGTLTR